jgi:archaellum component FlaF (FlaF/FlaG flagellin family)
MKKFIHSKVATIIIIGLISVAIVYSTWIVYYIAKIFINQ